MIAAFEPAAQAHTSETVARSRATVYTDADKSGPAAAIYDGSPAHKVIVKLLARLGKLA